MTLYLVYGQEDNRLLVYIEDKLDSLGMFNEKYPDDESYSFSRVYNWIEAKHYIHTLSDDHLLKMIRDSREYHEEDYSGYEHVLHMLLDELSRRFIIIQKEIELMQN